jgi:hypothetical protein
MVCVVGVLASKKANKKREEVTFFHAMSFKHS